MTTIRPNDLLAPYVATDVGAAHLARLIEGRLRGLVRLSRDRGLLHTDDSDDRLVRNLLSSLRLDLRLRPPPSADHGELERYLVVRASQLLGLFVPVPDLPPRPDRTGPPTRHSGYEIQHWERPLGPVSGDAVRVTTAAEGLWMLVADVTGHGRVAHLLAIGLEWLWDACMAELGDSASPVEVTNRIETELTPYLPEASFVEAAVVRAAPDGAVDVLAAGGVRLVCAPSAAHPPQLVVLCGHQLGVPALLGVPPDRDWSRIDLDRGGEVVFGTDGLFDQSDNSGRCLRDGLPWAERPACLFSAVLEAFRQAEAETPAHDDASVAALRRVDACRDAQS